MKKNWEVLSWLITINYHRIKTSLQIKKIIQERKETEKASKLVI